VRARHSPFSPTGPPPSPLALSQNKIDLVKEDAARQHYAQVRRIASLCKARLPDEFTRAFEAAGADEAAQFEAGVEFASRQVQGLLDGGVPGIHFYVLNKSTATSRVLRQVTVR
jgi:5,10-methylenetetrahydrofolate reductase